MMRNHMTYEGGRFVAMQLLRLYKGCTRARGLDQENDKIKAFD